jgi:hypothetical protein
VSERLARERPDMVTFVVGRGAGHVRNWNIGPTAYETAVAEFFLRILKATARQEPPARLYWIRHVSFDLWSQPPVQSPRPSERCSVCPRHGARVGLVPHQGVVVREDRRD